MSRKGLSLEEKKGRMMQLFYERKEFFQLKELEKLAPKEKGITANTVKDVLQALLDDAMIDTEKIGGSVYYWSFPSKVINNKKRKLEDLQTRYESSSKKLKLITKTLTATADETDQEENTAKILSEIEDLKTYKKMLEKNLQSAEETNPETLEKKKQAIAPIKEAANRWTENIFAVKSWCKKKFMIEEKVLNKQFSIPEDLDYVE